jgi:hypothetical protein
MKHLKVDFGNDLATCLVASAKLGRNIITLAASVTGCGNPRATTGIRLQR